MKKHEEFGAFGTFHGREHDLEAKAKLLKSEGYNVGYYFEKGEKVLHYAKEGYYDAIVKREVSQEPRRHAVAR